MSDLETKLRNARDSIETAVSKLKRAKNAVPEVYEIRRALSELSDAQDSIKKALRSLPD